MNPLAGRGVWRDTMTMRNFFLATILFLACDLPEDEFDAVELRDLDPHLPPDPAPTCVQILHADLRPATGLGAVRSVVISGFECAKPIDGLKLSVGPGPANDTSRDHVAGVSSSLMPGACFQVSGLAAVQVVPAWAPTCFPDGDWPTWHVILLAADNQLLDSVEMPFDLREWSKGEAPTGGVKRTTHGDWTPVGTFGGCELAL